MIRKIEEKDYTKIRRLVDMVHQFHYDNRSDIFKENSLLTDNYFRFVVNNSLSCVYEIDGNIVGVIIAFEKNINLSDVFQDRKICNIEVFVVDDEYQKMGIGHAMCDYLVENCKNNGIDAVELICYPFNKSAMDFYEELGFSVKLVSMEQVLK